MKLISWNVNGLRAVLKKGFMDFLDSCGADAVCLQETKMDRGQAEIDLAGWDEYWNSAQKKGYSGTAVFSRRKPKDALYNFGTEAFSDEGRVITLDYGSFFLVTAYVPNSGEALKRLPYRLEWDEAFRAYLKKLNEKKGVVVCGDLNVAHREIDLKHPKANERHAGYTPQERASFDKLLAAGFVDSYRYFYPDAKDRYTWWSYRTHSRKTNAGWRIDYFLVSADMKERMLGAEIFSDVMGSDHCPVGLTLADD